MSTSKVFTASVVKRPRLASASWRMGRINCMMPAVLRAFDPVLLLANIHVKASSASPNLSRSVRSGLLQSFTSTLALRINDKMPWWAAAVDDRIAAV